MASLDRHARNIGGLDQKRESQGWARPAPASRPCHLSFLVLHATRESAGP
jgi:hypothetical protein